MMQLRIAASVPQHVRTQLHKVSASLVRCRRARSLRRKSAHYSRAVRRWRKWSDKIEILPMDAPAKPHLEPSYD